MVKLGKEELGKLAKLSGLQLSEEESTELQSQLKLLLDYTDELRNLEDGEEVEATRSINVFREDKVKARDSKEIVQGAPGSQASYFAVPKILE